MTDRIVAHHPEPEADDRSLEQLAADELAVVDYAAELRSDRDTFRAWSIVLMGEVFRLTQVSRRQADENARLQAIVRDFITAAAIRRDGRAA